MTNALWTLRDKWSGTPECEPGVDRLSSSASTSGQTAAELSGNREQACDFLKRSSEVHETHAQAGPAVDKGGREKDATVTLHLAGEPEVVGVEVLDVGRHVPEAHG